MHAYTHTYMHKYSRTIGNELNLNYSPFSDNKS